MSEKNRPKGNPETQGSEGQKKAGGLVSGIAAAFIALLIVFLVFSGVFFFVLRNNLFRLADRFRADFDSNPILRLVLPPAPTEFDPDAAENLTPLQLAERYEAYRELILEMELELGALTETIETLEAEALTPSAIEGEDGAPLMPQQQLEEIARQRAELEILYSEVAEAAARGDTEGFRAYYEELDPEAAAAIYESIIKREAVDSLAEAAARPVGLMDSDAAAALLRELWAQDSNLVLAIANVSKAQTLAEILGEMDPILAAEITRELAEFRSFQEDQIADSGTSEQ